MLLLPLSACTQISVTEPTPPPSSGIEGWVTIGPVCPGPVLVGDTHCQDQPYQATISILDADNQEATRVQSSMEGYFKLPLPAGEYTLHPISGSPLPQASDQIVNVTADQYTGVKISYDTGMR
ncbi:MAG: hypothetical protein C3F13_09830 [Anaerolineales bacterium]|nr:MAG: hypothetical protein C3F13_09830 [Anaerolineales bacterium]